MNCLPTEMKNNGYFIIARQIFNSDVMEWPPEWFKLWIWLIGKANHETIKKGGVTYRRGEVLTSFKELAEVGGYKVGWYKKRLKKSNVRNFIEASRKLQMIVTKKSTRGFLIKIDRYDLFQDPKSYERHYERHNEGTMKAQTQHRINKNEKNEKNEKNKYIYTSNSQKPIPIFNPELE